MVGRVLLAVPLGIQVVSVLTFGTLLEVQVTQAVGNGFLHADPLEWRNDPPGAGLSIQNHLMGQRGRHFLRGVIILLQSVFRRTRITDLLRVQETIGGHLKVLALLGLQNFAIQTGSTFDTSSVVTHAAIDGSRHRLA